MTADISLSDYIAIRNIAFEWATSYDTKDWDRLRECLAPKIRLDFRSLQGELHDGISREQYVETLIGMIGDKRLKTQHLLGGAKWERQSDGSVEVVHQLRVAHQRYEAEDLAVEVNKGHAHGWATHVYRQFDGIWKLEAVAPRLDWFEHDLFGTLQPPEEKS